LCVAGPRYVALRCAHACRAGEGLELLPGIKDLLQALKRMPNTYVALVTGNMETIAWGKMEALSVADLFTHPRFGGFGSDHCSGNLAEPWRDRAEMIRIARRKAPGTSRVQRSESVAIFAVFLCRLVLTCRRAVWVPCCASCSNDSTDRCMLSRALHA
jgi:hypothetical protein